MTHKQWFERLDSAIVTIQLPRKEVLFLEVVLVMEAMRFEDRAKTKRGKLYGCKEAARRISALNHIIIRAEREVCRKINLEYMPTSQPQKTRRGDAKAGDPLRILTGVND
jgi:hypothetical protein